MTAPHHKHDPPRIATRIFLWYCESAAIEDLHGDIEEIFYSNLERMSLTKAKIKYWFHVISLLSSYAVKKRKRKYPYRSSSYSAIHPAMIKNYLKVALRTFTKNKAYSFINITGLSLGMAVSLTIALWIWDETTFNSGHSNHARVGQVYQNVTNNGEVQTWTSMPWPLAEELRKNYGTDFKQVVLATNTNYHLVSTPTLKFTKPGLNVEPGFIDMFSVAVTKGPREIPDPSSIFISESMAKAYFGDTDPVNQILNIDQEQTVHVAGVYRDFPANSTFSGIEFLASWDMLATSDWIKTMDDPWRPNGFMVYVQLNDQADFNTASARIKDAKLRKVNEQLAKKKPALFIHPMDQWHLYSQFRSGVNVGGLIDLIWLFGIIGAFVLLMACINFMNLSTAKSEQRAKEVGIRKSIGSWRSQLVAQFFTESTLVSLISLVVGIVLVRLMLPWFNLITLKQISLPWTSLVFWAAALGFSLFTGFIAGSYPALYLSSIQPGKALKGTYRASHGSGTPRKVLVVLQFGISVILIVGTVVVFQQIRFAQDRPIGYDRNSLVSSWITTEGIHKHFEAFRVELEKTGAVVAVAEATTPPTQGGASSSQFDWNGKDPNLSVDFSFFGASAEYGKTIGWEIKAGRDFSEDIKSDSTAIIINESAASYMGFKDPVGETVRWFGKPNRVIGVIHDIVFQSPYEPGRPTIYYPMSEKGNVLIMRLNPEKGAKESLASVEKVFKQFIPEEPFNFQFADEEHAKKFGQEDRIGKLAAFFTVLAIFISCLGIFGLSSFVAERRTKEIGIRKVLGASVVSLWGMLSREFVWLVAIALVFALPLAWYGMSVWLERYSYRTGIAWWILAAAGAGAFGITLFTVSFQAVKAALGNPVKSLRSE